ncbi:PhzF family phenazine biosynthesis protein [Sulfobacillus harzensis]|uniref:PhzF family phenazine biosynthesis protein n=1 Tax=Sulfobacillus harzensis TaxID=2729629 RepID=A0A7Y0Q2X5_9FIRM|nr:PhzF family phenazine biosynthesis protein [Sulfobacillus harzensis]NMP23613.1 PhzF family phenazine biosynthesis protein [Sulfobacillus harzensis]
MRSLGATGVPFYIVDVFTPSRYQGNPLAVVMDQFDDERMLAITREMNYSETTFVGPIHDDGSVSVRIFTPGGEIPFAGHPTLGTAFVLLEMRGFEGNRLVLREGVGPIPVYQDGGVYWMQQNPPEFQAVFEDRKMLASLLGIEVEDFNPNLPAEVVSTGLPALIVPLMSLDACRRAWLDVARYRALGRWPASVLVFAPGSIQPGHNVHVRVFVGDLGIPEDPATGSANGALAGYLQRYEVLGREVNAEVEQGVEMGRASSLSLRARPGQQGVAVEVGGRVQAVAEGWLVGESVKGKETM